MNLVYNTQSDISNKIRSFLIENSSCLHKPQLNFLPEVIFGIISSESVVASDISRSLKDVFSLIQIDSVTKRISRLFKNSRFLGHSLFNQITNYMISNFKLKHKDNRVHIIIDHMYSKENFTILLVSMRIASQGIPIYFEAFEGINNPMAFTNDTIIKAINFVHELFINRGFELIFLADRWFNSSKLLNHIDSLGHKFVIRFKGNISIRIFDKKEGHKIKMQTQDLFAYQYHSVFYKDVELYDDSSFSTTIIRSKRQGVKEPWILATNNDPKWAVKDYGYRFGGIETIFKNQKSNGFYLEDICNASLLYFDNLYATLCIAISLLTAIGLDFSRNSSCYKSVKITTHKMIHGKKTRVMSLFNTGLTLFKIAFNSLRYIRLPLNFILYDG